MFRSIKTDLRFVDETLHDCTYIDPPPPIPHTQCTSELIRAHPPPRPAAPSSLIWRQKQPSTCMHHNSQISNCISLWLWSGMGVRGYIIISNNCVVGTYVQCKYATYYKLVSSDCGAVQSIKPTKNCCAKFRRLLFASLDECSRQLSIFFQW